VNKVTSYIFGGLGNQLFCYSAGYYLSKKNNLDLELKISPAMNSTSRDSSLLLNLNLPGTFNQTKRVFITKILYKLSSENIVLRKFANLRLRKRIILSSLGYDDRLEQIKTTIYLQGYFQTWKYAQFSRELILKSLEDNVGLSDLAISLIARLKKEKTLVLHIRLGDYKKEENSYFGVLSPKYYQNLLANNNLSQYEIFIFSDDIENAQSEYATSLPSGVVWVDKDHQLSALETLFVMLHGSAFAIANSTFSWWAAYLSHRKEIVIAPSKWFKEHDDPIDLIPEDWIREESKWLTQV
jgi:hypothetical protein